MKGCEKVNRLKGYLGSTTAFIYFVLVMWWIILLLVLSPLMLFTDIQTIRESGFATSNVGMDLIGILGLFIGLSLLIPSIRKIYYKLPWLFPLVKILFIDVAIMGTAVSILNYGYEIGNATRHNIFYALMIGQIVVCRIAMCIYFHKKPIKHIGGEVNGKG